MGAEESVPIASPPSSAYPDYHGSPYFFFSLYLDTIHMVYAPQNVISVFLETVSQYCDISYHKQKHVHGYKLVLQDYYFSLGTSTDIAVRSRYLMAGLLLKLGQIGWLPVLSTDLKRMGDVANVLMQFNPQRRLTSVNLLVIGISGQDKIKILTHDERVTAIVKDAIQPNMSLSEISKGRASDLESLPYTKFKINGTPWSFVSENMSVASRETICNIIERLENDGFKLLVNFNTKPSADTYFFHYAAPEEPAYSFLTIGLNAKDQLRIISKHLDTLVVDAVREVVKKHWHRGLQNEWSGSIHHVFKLKGNPWWLDGAETVESRILTVKLLEKMMGLGWRLVCATDVSRKVNDKSTFIFRNVRRPVTVTVPCLSFNETNKIRAINMPGECLQALERSIKSFWAVSRSQQYGRSYEWKLAGSLWDGNQYYGKALCIHLLVEMNRHGYALLTSADVSAKYIHRKNAPDYPMDVHSWFFVPVNALHVPTTILQSPFLGHLSAGSPESRAPSPFQSAAVSPATSPFHTPASSTHGSPSRELRSSGTAPYWDPEFSNFQPEEGCAGPETNPELEEAPPPSYEFCVRSKNWV